MPRNRTARLAVLASSVQRSAPASYSSRTATSLRRRVVVVLLVVVSLALITGYFRESEEGALHDAQGVAASVLRPFQIGAERVARPFRDVYGYFAGLVHARAEAERLRRENNQLRQLVVENRFAAQERDELRRQLDYQASPTFPRDFERVSAEVVAWTPSQVDQEITISVGSRHGVRDDDPVVTPEGLVGKVTRVTPATARVTLITDEESGVSARVVGRRASGLLRAGHGQGDSLALDRVTKDHLVARGDRIVTAGWRLGELASSYPKGISIGVVSHVGQTDTDYHKRIQVDPYVDFSSLDAVIVLTEKRRRR